MVRWWKNILTRKKKRKAWRGCQTLYHYLFSCHVFRKSRWKKCFSTFKESLMAVLPSARVLWDMGYRMLAINFAVFFLFIVQNWIHVALVANGQIERLNFVHRSYALGSMAKYMKIDQNENFGLVKEFQEYVHEDNARRKWYYSFLS